jgi:hypothetical protein
MGGSMDLPTVGRSDLFASSGIEIPGPIIINPLKEIFMSMVTAFKLKALQDKKWTGKGIIHKEKLVDASLKYLEEGSVNIETRL